MKRKVILYFMIIILTTLSLVTLGFGITIKQYYYQSVVNTIKNHAEATIPEWTTGVDFSNIKIEDLTDEIMRSYNHSGADLKLLTRDGKLIQSSTGFYEDKTYSFDPSVLTLKTNYEIEKNVKTGENIMVIYTPLIFEGQIVGVLRYSTSLSKVDTIIINILGYVGMICIIVAFIVFIVSLHLGDSIVRPLSDIMFFAQRMAEGRYKERIEKKYPHEFGEMANMLNYMADEITKVERMKNDFISSISHELRTPLTGIKGWSETMQNPDELTDEELKLGLGIINTEVDRLMGLVENLLDFSRYQSERIELTRSTVQVNKLIEDVALQLQKKAEEKGIRIIIETVPIAITADGDKLRQVILNILDNAIKFSNNETLVHVTQSVNNDTVVIEISDKGIGVKQEDLKNILESFYKINPNSVGAGLGLAISHSIVEMHGGTIHIDSGYGNGTCVYITLPVECNKKD